MKGYDIVKRSKKKKDFKREKEAAAIESAIACDLDCHDMEIDIALMGFPTIEWVSEKTEAREACQPPNSRRNLACDFKAVQSDLSETPASSK